MKITYKDGDGKSVVREFKGTRDEVRDTIAGDDDLPESRKQPLLQMLEDRGHESIMENQLSRQLLWSTELFKWSKLELYCSHPTDWVASSRDWSPKCEYRSLVHIARDEEILRGRFLSIEL